MSTVLGLVGSGRRWGNSELLVREALLGAREAGASIEMICLTDLRLYPCTGCLKCALTDRPCPLDDDMEFLLEQARAADALILAAPTYLLGPAAVVKLALDRLLMLTPTLDEEGDAGRVGASIGVAGRPGWQGVTEPFLNALVMGLGFNLVDSLFTFAPGPGEALLDEAFIAQVNALGRRLAQGEATPSPVPDNVCPGCRSSFFFIEGQKATCPICSATATIAMDNGQVRLRFDLGPDYLNRFSRAGLDEDVNQWVRPSAGRFMERRHAIKERRARYRQMDDVWVRPTTPS